MGQEKKYNSSISSLLSLGLEDEPRVLKKSPARNKFIINTDGRKREKGGGKNDSVTEKRKEKKREEEEKEKLLSGVMKNVSQVSWLMEERRKPSTKEYDFPLSISCAEAKVFDLYYHVIQIT